VAKRLEVHPANCTLDMTQEQKQRLLEDIKLRGQQDPVKLLDGMIIDGRHLYEALMEIGVEPWAEEVELPEGVSAVEWVISHRSATGIRSRLCPGEVAVVIAKSDRMERGGKCDAPTIDALCGKIGDRTGIKVSRSVVRKVITILNSGVQGVDNLIAGGYSIGLANEIVTRWKGDARAIRSRLFGEDQEKVKEEIRDLRLAEAEARKAARDAKDAKDAAEIKAATTIPNQVEQGDPEEYTAFSYTESTEQAIGPVGQPYVSEVIEAAPRKGKASVSTREPVATVHVVEEAKESSRPISYVLEPVCSTEVAEDSVASKIAQIKALIESLPESSRVEVAKIAIDSVSGESRKEVAKYASDFFTLGYDPREIDLTGKLGESPEFRRAWIQWCDYLEDRGRALTPDKAREHIDKVKHKSTAAMAIDCLEYAIDSERYDPVKKPQRAKSAAAFVPPKLHEVLELAKVEKLSRMDPEEFFYHYEGNGWKVGDNSMVDWRAAMRRWNRSSERTPNGSGRGGGGVVMSRHPNYLKNFKGDEL
jgi:hypothetical protein